MTPALDDILAYFVFRGWRFQWRHDGQFAVHADDGWTIATGPSDALNRMTARGCILPADLAAFLATRYPSET